ncbi:hypothetical protein AbraCBS73388_010024 [Aspergillus brasiliensis]|uniref:Uncharacterized protein n=1 Tax=Aspergillus brasiliensis TaxID=319629 RepID=A0A9W6DK47_9EURO|nr:hypothetical protein AbraCBS73388_010024 [Aspergillus brasiliensis]
MKPTQSKLLTLIKFSAATTLASAGGWQLWTGNCYFEPFGPDNDPLFQSEYFRKYNPGNHPSLNDSCVRKVPLSRIPKELVEDALRGGSQLMERFCAGVWGGYGYSIQRNILGMVAKDEGNAGSMLWDKKQLLSSSYDEGTIVTNHFKVVAKTPTSIIMWGAESPPTNPEVRREMENLSEVSTNVDVDKGVVEFRLKNIFYNGAERITGDLFPPPIVWLHFQYCKLLVEGGVSHCVV